MVERGDVRTMTKQTAGAAETKRRGLGVEFITLATIADDDEPSRPEPEVLGPVE